MVFRILWYRNVFSKCGLVLDRVASFSSEGLTSHTRFQGWSGLIAHMRQTFSDVLKMKLASLREVFVSSPEAIFLSVGLTSYTRFKEWSALIARMWQICSRRFENEACVATWSIFLSTWSYVFKWRADELYAFQLVKQPRRSHARDFSDVLKLQTASLNELFSHSREVVFLTGGLTSYTRFNE